MPARIFAALGIACCLQAAPARAETFGEADVRRRVAAHPRLLAERAEVFAADSRGAAAGKYPNPTLWWEREHFPSSEREDAVGLTLPLDLSGRRAALRAMARSETASARAGETRTRSAVTLEALETFYAALAAERTVRAQQKAVEGLEEAARVLGERRTEGVISGYEVSRLSIQLELSRADLERARAELASTRAELAFLLETDPKALVLRGTLAPEQVPAPVRAASERPSLQQARAAASEARAAEGAAEHAWIPVVQVSGGLRIGETDRTRYGYVAGVAFEVPLFSRGQELAAEALARKRVTAARASSLEHAARSAELSAQEQLAGALSELQRLRGVADEHAQQVLRAAESSYREGARPLLELLDARRMATELELRRIDTEHRVRRAELELRAARAAFE